MHALSMITRGTLAVEVLVALLSIATSVPNAYAQGAISVRLDVEKSTVAVGEPVVVTLVATNVSASLVQIPRNLDEFCELQRRGSAATSFETVRPMSGYASNRRRRPGSEPVAQSGEYSQGPRVLLSGQTAGSLLLPQVGEYDLQVECKDIEGVGDVDSTAVHVSVLATPANEEQNVATMSARPESMLIEGQWFRAPEGVDSLRTLVDTSPSSMYAQYALLRLGEYDLDRYFDTVDPDPATLQRARDYLQRALDSSTSATVTALASAALARAQPRSAP